LTTLTATAIPFSLNDRLIAGALALFIGLTLLGGVGFAHNTLLHNGAHDTRHAMGFPCH
jgi:cobalt transporter subunit CbtB